MPNPDDTEPVTSAPRGTPVRRQLWILAAACTVPLAIMGAISLWGLQHQQDEHNRQVGLELARSVAGAVDAELRRVSIVLQTLATSPQIDRGNLHGVLERARRVERLSPEWVAIVMSDPAGRSLLDSRTTKGSPELEPADPGSVAAAVRTGNTAVGNLFRDRDGQWLFPVATPVVQAGAVRYVLTAFVKPAGVRDLLIRQRVPRDWVISIIDANGRRVARSKAHEQNLGGPLSPTAQRVVRAGGAEGVGLSYSLEGARILTPYSRIGGTGWMAVLGIPTTVLDAAAFRSLAVYGGGILLSILLAVFGGAWVARTIARPMAALRAAAGALARHEIPRPPRTSIHEIRAVGEALETAGGELAAARAANEGLLRKERRAREAAEAADRAKDEFLAVVSHELRTPLNAVYGWARMLQSRQIQDEATIARAMDAIVRNSDMQVQIIDDLLDLSRITSGKMRLNVVRVELEGVVQGALDAVRPAAVAKGIALNVAIDDGSSSITADPARLQQVLWNLLMNAVKFTPRGGRVSLEATRRQSAVHLVVRDTGQGIGADMLPHVFERFRQADSSSTRAHGGLGLGLALVKHLAELHGGTVVAESDGPGKGAAFTVTLPVVPVAARPDTALGRPAAVAAVPGDVVRLDGTRVLVVDDDAEGVAIVEAILVRAGADVRTCSTAMQGFESVRTWRPHVLVSDVGMPDEDGYSLIRRVRALPPGEGGLTVAIALTGFGRAQDRQQALAAGFHMHVPKPVDPHELTTIVAGLLERLRPA
jgi:signal transduction histidine kinase/ActR/RegA family two-component response regulator